MDFDYICGQIAAYMFSCMASIVCFNMNVGDALDLLLMDGMGSYHFATKCNEILHWSKGQASNGLYTSASDNGQGYSVYCQFYSGFGYAFIPLYNNVDIDISSLSDDTSEVVIRHKRQNGVQYSAKIEQLSDYLNVPVYVGLNEHTGYKGHINTNMGSYLFTGFIPQSMITQGGVQGWKVNGIEFNFTNCDGNKNSYFVILDNENNTDYQYKANQIKPLMVAWYDISEQLQPQEYLPGEFMSPYYEVHHGGCGGYLTGSSLANVTGVAVGVKFLIKCLEPDPVLNAEMSIIGLQAGRQVTYTCVQGYSVVRGNLTRTCTDRGVWSGSIPVCKELLNVALGQAAYQSDSGNASLAVDGGLSQLYSDGACLHVPDTVGAYWEVDLGEVYVLHHVTVLGTLDDCCNDNLQGAMVYTGLAQTSYEFTSQQEGALSNSSFTVVFDDTIYAKWVQISHAAGVNKSLTLCEVQVMGYKITSKVYKQQENAVGSGTVLQELTISSVPSINCCRRCFRKPECMSVNVYLNTSLCQLLGSIDYTASGDRTVEFFLPVYSME